MASTNEILAGTPAPEILDDRIWVDGCWDFFHHGHAGAMLQARQLGTELYVGVHSDEDILDNKGPTVMTLQERLAAVDACRWVTKSVSHAPYVTQLDFISHYGCKYVVHGDDITSDSGGEDCYRFVKAAGRFKSLEKVLAGDEGHGTESERKAEGDAMSKRIQQYATDASGKNPGADVWFWSASQAAKAEAGEEEKGSFRQFLKGAGPQPGQRVVYVDGGFDLFSSGHIEFLRLVVEAEESLARKEGWYDQQAVDERKGKGGDYGPLHDDEVINQWKGVNYPIMNIYERSLCVLQCRHVNAVIYGAPFSPTKAYLTASPWGTPDAVYHGPTSFMPLSYDPYEAPKQMGIFQEISQHLFQGVNAGTIVQRIMESRALYEERQRKKGMKATVEGAAREREILEEEQRRKEENMSKP
ncbi:Ethanolamine-phosphate cytidylyltransferase [Apiospora phragmitis]|uniref:ethanolamine-phosphate cytidylyltransferase n=1 Tax=Apiospora phragmitis TaxID=2905665 RepID=A0ABR1TV55_9PEZI